MKWWGWPGPGGSHCGALDLLLTYSCAILEILAIPEERRISKFRGISPGLEFQLYYDI